MFLIYRKRSAAMQAVFFLIGGVAALMGQEDLAGDSHRAKELMAQQRFAEAIPIYEHLVKAVPGNVGLILNLALAQEMAGRPADAIPNFAKVLKASPDSIPALISISMAQLQLSHPREAIAPLRKVVKLDPGNRNALGMLAEAEFSTEAFEQAAQHFRNLSAQDGSDARAWDGLCRTYEALATRTFERLNQAAPESAHVAILLADTRVERSQFRSAFFFYHEAQRQSPELPGIHAGLAQVYRGTQHPDWAEVEQKKEQALAAPNCKVQAAECLFVAGSLVESAQTAAAPNASATTLFWAIKAYNELAARAFQKLSQLPESVQIHALKAQILVARRQSLEAANEWRAALKLAPDDDKVKRAFASALFDAKDYAGAIPRLQEGLAKDASAPDLNYLMGTSLFRTEQPEKALPYLEAAVRDGKETPPVDAAMGLTLVALNQNAEAIPYLKKALALDDDGSLHYSLARAYRAASDSQLAAETMQQYQTIQKRNQQINDQLAKDAEITAPLP